MSCMHTFQCTWDTVNDHHEHTHYNLTLVTTRSLMKCSMGDNILLDTENALGSESLGGVTSLNTNVKSSMVDVGKLQ